MIYREKQRFDKIPESRSGRIAIFLAQKTARVCSHHVSGKIFKAVSRERNKRNIRYRFIVRGIYVFYTTERAHAARFTHYAMCPSPAQQVRTNISIHTWHR